MATIRDLVASVRITDYLAKKGVSLIRAGRRTKCSCPLPGHKTDKTPSFYISTTSDGVELFKCFGCGAAGGIISLMRLMDGMRTNGEVIRRLASERGIVLDKWDPAAKMEPIPDEVLKVFCEEDTMSLQVSKWVSRFIEVNHGAPDAVYQVQRFYKEFDRRSNSGDVDGMIELFEAFQKNVILKYRGIEGPRR